MTGKQLLEQLWQNGQYSYYWTAPDKQSYWFPANKPGPVPNGNRNVYFGVNPAFAIPSTNARGEKRSPKYIRSQNDYIGAINAVFGEYDLKDWQTEEAIFDHLSDFPVPSTTIFSGGGFHLYWYLDKSFVIESEQNRERAKRLQANWVDYTGSDKQSKDLARVLRVPGTRNYKECYAPNFPIVAIIDHNGKTYSLPFLEKLSEPPPQEMLCPLPQPTRLATSDDRQRFANHALRVASDMVRQSVDGEKHGTLLRAARLLGGYVAGGILSEDSAIRLLEQEIGHKPNIDSLNGAYKTIRDGLEYGKAEPITLEQKLAEWQVWQAERQVNHTAKAGKRADRRYWSRQFEGYWERVR